MRILGTIITASCFFLLACTERNQGGAQSEQQQSAQTTKNSAKPVGIITLKAQAVNVNKALPARVAAYKTAEIRPQVSGIIEEIHFQQGSWVEKGQQLYQIDESQFQADYQSAQAQVKNSKAELEIAEVVQKRYKNLVKSNAISQQELDNSNADVARAKAALALAEAGLKRAEINLAYTKVLSPIEGYIGPSTVTQGALVTAQQSLALSTVRQIDPIFVDISQSASAAKQLQQGLAKKGPNNENADQFKVKLTLGNDANEYPYSGKLFATDLAVDENTGTIRIRSVFPNPEAILLPGMFVRASLQNLQQQQALLVPQKAVILEPDSSKSVWLVTSNNTVEKQKVVANESYQNNWVIAQGLNPGDRVVIEGMMQLREGVKVEAKTIESSQQ